MQLFSRMYFWTAQPPQPVLMINGSRMSELKSVFRNRTGITALSFKEAFLKES
jgi:hypothetical protein